MSELSDKIYKVVDDTRGMLKDFQRATVDRVDELFQSSQNRVLVADEVGMGKTMIAKGTIAMMAKRRLEAGWSSFKVIYVCSNQSIANQNISELDVFDVGHEDISSTRLSMQHLLVEKTRYRNEQQFIQLIPLTPQTSFNTKSGQGKAEERALIYCILKRLDEFLDETLRLKLEQTLMFYVGRSSWKPKVDWYDRQVKIYEKASKGDYPMNLLLQIMDEAETLKMVIEHLHTRPITEKDRPYNGDWECIVAMRKLFAKISIQYLQPDLVIMDEFQNFQFLLNTQDEEIKALTDCFFGNTQSYGNEGHETKVLLLSATPYKLYTTLEEIGDTNQGDHYGEFMDVMKFLYRKKDRFERFRSVWQDYSMSLKEISEDKTSMLVLKEKVALAQEEMYGAVCRTERISVMDNGDYTDDTSKNYSLRVHESDIRTYVQAMRLMAVVEKTFRVDYVKSCPYPMSFMTNYVEKKRLKEYFSRHPEDVREAQKQDLLWIDKKKINRYQPLPAVNARLELLKEKLFTPHAELLLWMPPACPYYKPYGVFGNQEDFSKILIFSSWEMVPRMIGSLISYEEERRTVGELVRRHADKIDEQSQMYFLRSSEKKKRTRYPAGRLKSTVLPTFALLYPSRALAEAYAPKDYLHDGITDIVEIEAIVKEYVHEQLETVISRIARREGNRDNRWYHLAPMLMDEPERVVEWIDSLNANGDLDTDVEQADESGQSMSSVLVGMRKLFVSEDGTVHRVYPGTLGRVPDDLEEVMVSLAIASPAVCLLRTLGDWKYASRIARAFQRYFNSPESTAIVELACSKRRIPSDDSHWMDVLKYCKMGNIQAMIDEYVHLLRKGHELAGELSAIEKKFSDCLSLHSSPYNVESYKEFVASVKSKQTVRAKQRIRTHYGAGFSKGDESDKTVARKDNLRTAFNSPFWPFVLASTSIGQEGLDFHLYCRKIMHWNLPSNPVDLEQREGRINRFKCLAIRQNVARKYTDAISANGNDCWEELFEAAMAERKGGQSELIPFWCFGENQEVKIERILPMYPISKDSANYDRLIKVLSLYRLTLGQTRQDDLLNHVFSNFQNPDELKSMFIDLSPYSHNQKKEK